MINFMRLTLNILLLILLLLTVKLNASEIILEGIYQGENLFVQNPFGLSDKEFCITEIQVNGEIVTSNPKISALEVDLSGFEINDPLVIKILHHDNCIPHILNPRVVVFKREFKFLSVLATQDHIQWITLGEKGNGEHTIERLEESEWRELDKVQLKGGFDVNEYKQGVIHNVGRNKYQIRMTDVTGQEILSQEFEFLIDKPPITFSPVRVTDRITLSEKAFYEVLDLEENQITKGTGRVIKLKGLPPGEYYINIEGKRQKFYKL